MLSLLASGRTADVYALDDGRVLRRYRDGFDTVAAERAVMAHVAAHGFPVPRVDSASGTDLVMERLDGPTMLEAMLAGRLDLPDSARMLADLHTRLHGVPARVSPDPGDRVLHLDLHPGNVLLTGRGPVVIDWRNATEGPPALDVAFTALIIAEAGTAPDAPPAVSGMVPVLVRAFLDAAGVDVSGAVDRAVAIRAADRSLSPEEAARVPAAAALLS